MKNENVNNKVKKISKLGEGGNLKTKIWKSNLMQRERLGK